MSEAVSISVDELYRRVEQAKREHEEFLRRKSELVKKLYNAAGKARLWGLVEAVGTWYSKKHGYWVELKFNWKGREVYLGHDTYNCFLKIRVDGKYVVNGCTLPEYNMYMTDNLELVEQTIQLLEDLARTDIPRLVDLLDEDATYKAGLDSQVKQLIRQILGLEELQVEVV